MNNEIVATEPILPMSPEVAKAAVAQYQQLTAAMLAESDWQKLPDGKFVKRSGWSKISAAYNCSTEILTEEIDFDEDGQPIRAYSIVRAVHPGGRFADGSGRCTRDESRFATARGRAKIGHDLPSTAVTRATNRAISNLIGFGQMSAEEVDGVASAPFGPEGDESSDAQAAAIVDELWPQVQGVHFVGLVCAQFGTDHLPQASARMLAAIKWALKEEARDETRGNIRDEEVQS